MAIIIGVCLLGIVAARFRADEMQSGLANIFTLVFAIVICVSLLAWFLFGSGFSAKVRVLGVLVVATTLFALAATLEIRRTDAALTPQISWRWSLMPDQLLDPAKPEVADDLVDLKTTTEQDFPQFLGPLRQAIVTNLQLNPDWKTSPPQVVWLKKLGAAWSGFAAVNGYGVTLEQRGPQELVTCYEVATGELRWTHSVETRHATVLGFVGPRSTPTIHHGKVYALGATGVLRCLNGADGTPVWQRNLLKEMGLDSESDKMGVAWGRANSPLVVDDKLIVPLGGPAEGPWISLIALDLETGQTIWEGGEDQASYSSPTLSTLLGRRQILIVNQDSVSSHDVDDGETLWRYDWPGKSNTDANVSQPVTIGDNRVLLSKGYGMGAELIELAEDPDEWLVESIWKERRVLKTKMTSAVVKDGYAYGLDEGILSCVEVETGQSQWKDGRYGHGQLLLVGDHLLISTEEGDLVLVRATPESFQELARQTILTDQTWNTLCLTGPYLLMRNSEEVACVRLK